MRRFLFITAWLIAGYGSFGQADISAVEYFIDTDPGVGLATTVSTAPGSTIDFNFTVPVSSLALSPGFHILGVRTQNSDGQWSMYEKRSFYIQDAGSVSTPSTSDVSALEYYVDEDPGVGSGTLVDISQASFIDLDFDVPTSSMGLDAGFHILGLRTQNALGRWSMHERRVFYVQETPTISNPVPIDISSLEYFIDDDPGIGQATEISISTGSSIDIASITSASALAEGWHILGLRAKSADERWGFTEKRRFYVDGASAPAGSVANITQLEYFVDEDPGRGFGIEIPVSPATDDVDIANIDIPTDNSLNIGTHTLNVRARNAQGRWGFVETVDFEIDGDCPIADFDVEIFCAGEAVQITDLSTEPTGTAAYRWYADGILISSTIGDISHIFENSGDHTLSLAIENGLTCTDSTGVAITVKPKPIVVFYAEPATLGNPSNFIVDQFNVDDGSTWSWDFNNDESEDDNTAGNTSFTYGAIGTYTAILTITDGFGCGTTFTRDVEVIDGVQAFAADFSSTIVCQGDATSFTDTSTGVPGGATYSWDFENDGTPDDTTIGDVTFTYSAGGTFMATLTIDAGAGSTTTVTKVVTVVENPTASFSFGNACVGTEITFTNTTTSAGGSATFDWDFDGDGTIDSNATGDATFTYSSSGVYPVSLVVDNGNGCFDIEIQNISVDPVPESDFDFSYSTVGVTTAMVQFENLAEGIGYSWDFGDGNTSMEENPLHEYPNYLGETYEVCLTVSNNCTQTVFCQNLTLTVTSLEEELDEKIVVFPNPSLGVSYLQFSEDLSGSYEITMYNLAGKLIKNQSIEVSGSDRSLAIEGLSSGSYLIKVSSDKGDIFKRMLVK